MNDIQFQTGTIKTHNGTITIKNPATGEHRTFQIRTQPDDARFAPGKRIVSLLDGSNNEFDYTGFGFVNDDGSIAVWRKKSGGVFDVYARMLSNPESFQKRGAEYLFAGKCRICNRKLTTPESIERGIGPVCAEKTGIVSTGRATPDVEPVDPDFETALENARRSITRRNNQTVFAGKLGTAVAEKWIAENGSLIETVVDGQSLGNFILAATECLEFNNPDGLGNRSSTFRDGFQTVIADYFTTHPNFVRINGGSK